MTSVVLGESSIRLVRTISLSLAPDHGVQCLCADQPYTIDMLCTSIMGVLLQYVVCAVLFQLAPSMFLLLAFRWHSACLSSWGVNDTVTPAWQFRCTHIYTYARAETSIVN